MTGSDSAIGIEEIENSGYSLLMTVVATRATVMATAPARTTLPVIFELTI